MQNDVELADLAREMMELESETFEIKDYAEANGAILEYTSSSSTSTCSSTTSSGSTSCTA